MRHLFLLSLLATAACGQAHRVAVASEPNAIEQPSLVGTYDVAYVSVDANCVWNDTTWTVERTDEPGIYRVDTAAQTAYVTATDVAEHGGTLAWSKSLYYTNNGCNYGVRFDYTVRLDSEGNLTGSVAVRPDASCGPANKCDYAVASQRITDDAE